MIHGIDHIVIAVPNLRTAISDYESLGFTVVRGGRHSQFNTHNALIAFADGCYFELIASLDPPSAATHWWFDALRRGGGLTDFCALSHDLEDDLGAFRRAGVTMSSPFVMDRERPDGYRLSWKLSVNKGETRGLVPFLICDISPRDERVPRECTHRNGATGVKSLAIVVAQISSTQAIYEGALRQSGQSVRRDDLQAEGLCFRLGTQEVQLIKPRDPFGTAAERLRTRGPSPVAVELQGGAGHGALDMAGTHGALIAFG